MDTRATPILVMVLLASGRAGAAEAWCVIASGPTENSGNGAAAPSGGKVGAGADGANGSKGQTGEAGSPGTPDHRAHRAHRAQEAHPARLAHRAQEAHPAQRGLTVLKGRTANKALPVRRAQTGSMGRPEQSAAPVRPVRTAQPVRRAALSQAVSPRRYITLGYQNDASPFSAGAEMAGFISGAGNRLVVESNLGVDSKRPTDPALVVRAAVSGP